MSQRLIFGDMTSLIKITLVFGFSFVLSALVFHDALVCILKTSIKNAGYLYNF